MALALVAAVVWYVYRKRARSMKKALAAQRSLTIATAGFHSRVCDKLDDSKRCTCDPPLSPGGRDGEVGDQAGSLPAPTHPNRHLRYWP